MEVAGASGSVGLRLYRQNGEQTREFATFHWRAGATLEFLEDALTKHSRNLILSCGSRPTDTSTFDISKVQLTVGGITVTS